MRADDQRLLDIGGFGRPGDKRTKTGIGKCQSLIRLMHVFDDFTRGYDKRQMLGDEIDHAMPHGRIRYPDGAVLRHPELTR